MNVLKNVSLVTLALAGTIQVANAQDRNGIIRDALQRGAHVVQCQNDRCQDQTTMEYLDHDKKAPDGVYLVYPNTPESTTNIARTRDGAKTIAP